MSPEAKYPNFPEKIQVFLPIIQIWITKKYSGNPYRKIIPQLGHRHNLDFWHATRLARTVLILDVSKKNATLSAGDKVAFDPVYQSLVLMRSKRQIGSDPALPVIILPDGRIHEADPVFTCRRGSAVILII